MLFWHAVLYTGISISNCVVCITIISFDTLAVYMNTFSSCLIFNFLNLISNSAYQIRLEFWNKPVLSNSWGFLLPGKHQWPEGGSNKHKRQAVPTKSITKFHKKLRNADSNLHRKLQIIEQQETMTIRIISNLEKVDV